jgi:hypothetical protein
MTGQAQQLKAEAPAAMEQLRQLPTAVTGPLPLPMAGRWQRSRR